MKDKIECLICHRLFRTLGFHLNSRHGISGEEYGEMFPDGSLMCEEMRRGLSQNTTKYWLLPNSPYKTQEYSQKKSRSMKKLRIDPNSTFNSDEYKENHLQAIHSPQHKQRLGASISKLWADPNSKYNSPEFRAGMSEFGKTRVGEKNSMYGKHWYATPESIEKYRTANLGERNPAWRGGTSFEPYPPTFNGQLKEATRKRDNYTCQLCGIRESQLLQKLSVHHMDYNKDNCSLTNLISLCRSCNGKVNTNREYWREYFTHVLDRQNNEQICFD